MTPATVVTHAPRARGGVGQDIPFRPEGPGLASSALDVTMGLVVVLGLALAGLLFARKKGWLERWTGAATPAAPTLRIEQRLRLSPRTMLYRVRDGNARYLVLESSANARLHPLPATEPDDA